MPCVVPTCKATDGNLRPFPQHPSLVQRWQEAIQLGCGAPLELPATTTGLEICQWHFRLTAPEGEDSKLERYREPSCFITASGEYSDVSSCRMCLNFYPTATMVSKAGILGDNDITYCVYELMSIIFQDSDFLEMICQECLVRLDVMSSMQVFFATAEDAFQQIVQLAEGRGGESQVEDGEDVKFEGQFKEETQAIVEEVIEEMQVEVGTAEDVMEEFVTGHEYSSAGWSTEEEDEGPKREIERREAKRGRKQKQVRRKLKREQENFDEPAKPRRIPKNEPKTTTVKRDKNGPSSLKAVRTRKCYICVQVLTDANELMSHLTEVHAPTKDFHCKECGVDFPQVITFNVHLSRHDETERPYKCEVCPLRFGCLNSKKVHEQRAHGMHPNFEVPAKIINPVVCEHCGRVFENKTCLASHTRAKHKKSDNVPTCNICRKTFTARSSLERHMLLHNNEKPFACSQCDKTYRRNLDLKHHVELVHEGKNPHFCAECAQSFQSYQALYLHKKFTHGKNTQDSDKAKAELRQQRYLSCALCKTVNSTTDELTAHIEVVHPNEEYPYVKCPEPTCSRTFLTSHHRAHHKEIHTDKYRCDICGARNASIQRLQIHIENKHTEVRKYDCTVCIKTYKTATALRTHMREHTEGKRFECEFCSKTFSRKDQMVIHRRLHTGERPFSCPVCSKRFSDDGTFSKHKKRCQAALQNQLTQQQEDVMIEFVQEDEAAN
ncbi:zinc finger protein 431-like isoform X1 [Culex pipiens pallens]|uniref:zinc finger protein 431-like isoform X1 n=2 Tax=Culex pipiens pallens TaxID=42434 RepID=UPI001952D82D|nr:zinc finger protein 431-like isoform X1 [Culex pipiens pallens]